jgi:dipeptidyl aminopeptidase/acylaminoacyl peptidase
VGGRLAHPPRRRTLLLALAAVVLLGLVGGGVAGYGYLDGVYREQVVIDTAWCRTPATQGGSTFWDSTPAAFQTASASTGPYVDTTPYLMPTYATVSFASRDPGVTIEAWWVPGRSPTAPVVILAHGRGRCRGDPEVLLPAGMLHRHGFAVLLIDLRNHGGSTVTDGRHTFGIHESQDMLGAWDWLRSEHGLAANRIGLLGVSLGAVTGMIAIGREPRVAALWEDSGLISFDEGVRDLVKEKGLPDVLASPIASFLSTIHGIDDSPAQELPKVGTRPFAIVHGSADATVAVRHATLIAAAVRAGGGSVEPWILPGVAHVRASFVATAEYERRLVAFFSSALGAP